MAIDELAIDELAIEVSVRTAAPYPEGLESADRNRTLFLNSLKMNNKEQVVLYS